MKSMYWQVYQSATRLNEQCFCNAFCRGEGSTLCRMRLALVLLLLVADAMARKVVIVGGGLAGLSATIEATEAGAEVGGGQLC